VSDTSQICMLNVQTFMCRRADVTVVNIRTCRLLGCDTG